MDGDYSYAQTHLRMNDRTANQKGSTLNDLIKLLHKLRLPPHMFGCDVDLMIVEKNPDCIVAFKDFKRIGEQVTFSEVIAYNQLMKVAPIYLIYAGSEQDAQNGVLTVYRYLGGNRGPNPPTIRMELYARLQSWEEYRRWEQELRNATKPNGAAQ